MKICPENNVLDELLQLLKLEQIEENIFRGQSQDLGFGTVYGGQVLGQALSAAYQTVPPERRAHSLHSYFLRPGDVRRPIVYNVDCIRDGKSFTTRRVVAVQKGRPIFNLAASFQIDEPLNEMFSQSIRDQDLTPINQFDVAEAAEGRGIRKAVEKIKKHVSFYVREEGE